MNPTGALLRAVPTSVVAALFVLGVIAVAKWLGKPLAARFEHALWTCVLAVMLAFAVPKMTVHAGPPIAPDASRYTEPVAPFATSPFRPIGRAVADSASGDRKPVPTSGVTPLPPRLPIMVWFVVWLAGAGLMTLRICVGVFLTQHGLAGARTIMDESAIRFLVADHGSALGGVEESANAVVPMTVGWPYARIFLPMEWRTWSSDKVRAVMVHEMAHARRRDALVTFLAAVNKAIFWFYPLAWWLEHRLEELAEFAADDAAVKAMTDRRDYAAVLVEIASSARPVRLRWNPVSVEFAQRGVNRINRRVDRIFDARARAGSVKVVWAVATVIAVLSLVQFQRPVRAQEPSAQDRDRGLGSPGNATGPIARNPEDSGATTEQERRPADPSETARERYQKETLNRQVEKLQQEMAQKVEELARRQSDLARQQQANPNQLAQQLYQEEMLQREAEQLRQQMAQLSAQQQQLEELARRQNDLIHRQQANPNQLAQQRYPGEMLEQLRQQIAQLVNGQPAQQTQPEQPEQREQAPNSPADALLSQAPSRRLLHVTVTDPQGRFVTSLDRETFEIIENGVSRPITDFEAGSPISLAIVSEMPLAVSGVNRPDFELIQTRSISDALRQLSASKNARRVVVVTTADTVGPAVPAGIQVVQSSPDNVFREVIELRSQYLLQFESTNNSANVEVVLHPPRGMPALQPNLK